MKTFKLGQNDVKKWGVNLWLIILRLFEFGWSLVCFGFLFFAASMVVRTRSPLLINGRNLPGLKRLHSWA